MQDRPLWKRVGIRKAEPKGENNESAKDPSSAGAESRSACVSPLQQKTRMRSNTAKLQQSLPINWHNEEEEIFQSALNKFKELGVTSQPQSPEPAFEKPLFRPCLGSICEVESPEAEPIRTRNTTNDDRVKIKLVRLHELLRTYREELDCAKEQILLGRAGFADWLRTALIQKFASSGRRKPTRESSCQTEKAVHFKHSKHSDQTQLSESVHEDLLTVEPPKRRDMGRSSQVKSENERERDKTMLSNLELRQQNDLLLVRNHTLEAQMEQLKQSFDLERQDKEQQKINDLQGIYAANKALMKETIEKYMHELFEKDHVISSLKAQLGQKIEELTKSQARKSEVTSVVSEMGIGAIYTKRYKELYEKVEVERLKLRAELDSALRDRDDTAAELQSFREESKNVIHQNIELSHRIQDLEFEYTQKMHEMKSSLTKDSKHKIGEYSKQIHLLKDQLEQREKKIAFLDQVIMMRNQNDRNSVLINDESEQNCEEQQQNYIVESKPSPKMLDSIRSLPGAHSPVYNPNPNNFLRQTVRQVPRIDESNPKLRRKNTQQHEQTHGSMGVIHNTRYEESRQPSRVSQHLRVATTEKNQGDVMSYMKGPSTPQMPKYQRWKAARPSGNFQRRNLTEQVQTLETMMRSELQSSVLRKGY